MARLSPYSRAKVIAKVDGRTVEAKLLRTTRAELTAHLGGTPSATQRVLIDRAAMLTLHLALLDKKTLFAGGTLTEHDSKQYLAWSNALGRAVRDLGMKGATQRASSLAEIMARSILAPAPLGAAD